jgi:two-component system C4-dicarboxylate transport sensor histidine kinase DctB
LVVQSIDRMIRRQLDVDGIGLTTEVCADTHHLRGDPLRLEQVVMNLISNARAAVQARAAAEGPDFHGEIRLACECRADRVRLSVGDNGTGIAKAHFNRVFESFFSTKEVGEGLGLGLAISSTIVKSFGGEITFTSEPGATVFWVDLPASHA